MNDLDPSKQRDEEAAATATVRTDEAAATATHRDDIMSNDVRRLSNDMHTMKGALAVNTAFTKEIMEHMDQISGRQTSFDEKLETIVRSTADIVEAFAISKTGLNFFKAVGMWARKIAVWSLPLVMLAAALWRIFHGDWPKIEE